MSREVSARQDNVTTQERNSSSTARGGALGALFSWHLGIPSGSLLTPTVTLVPERGDAAGGTQRYEHNRSHLDTLTKGNALTAHFNRYVCVLFFGSASFSKSSFFVFFLSCLTSLVALSLHLYTTCQCVLFLVLAFVVLFVSFFHRFATFAIFFVVCACYVFLHFFLVHLGFHNCLLGDKPMAKYVSFPIRLYVLATQKTNLSKSKIQHCQITVFFLLWSVRKRFVSQQDTFFVIMLLNFFREHVNNNTPRMLSKFTVFNVVEDSVKHCCRREMSRCLITNFQHLSQTSWKVITSKSWPPGVI